LWHNIRQIQSSIFISLLLSSADRDYSSYCQWLAGNIGHSGMTGIRVEMLLGWVYPAHPLGKTKTDMLTRLFKGWHGASAGRHT
jgi:hypothetical protein